MAGKKLSRGTLDLVDRAQAGSHHPASAGHPCSGRRRVTTKIAGVLRSGLDQRLRNAVQARAPDRDFSHSDQSNLNYTTYST
jgi:hypothetical protein